MSKILTVDPGVYTMGACLWDEEEWNSKECCFPDRVLDVVTKDHDRKKIDPSSSMNDLVLLLKDWFEEYDIKECHCEKPQFFCTARGFATGIKGNLLQLEMFRGMLFMLCQDYGTEFKDVPVTSWKGQLSKDKVIDRIKILFTNCGANVQLVRFSANQGNDWDACGIGLYLQGFF